LKISAFEDNFKKIINSLESIHEEGLKEKKGAWVFAKKAYEKKFGNFIDAVKKLLGSSLGKGFVALGRDSEVNIEVRQTISINVIKEHFSYLVINIIK
jgi:hypothetical protein